jgi:3-phosphoshikimate 1-carboxyvinyltransferase
VVSPAPFHAPPAAIDCGDAGTTIRFCAALSLLLEGPLALDGDEHMRRRPIGDLADALQNLGVRTRWLATPGFPPLELQRTGDAAAEVAVDASRSSQFASALLLVAARLPLGLHVRLRGGTVSRPYLDLTVEGLRTFGGRVDEEPDGYRVAPGALRCARFVVDGDWSGGAFLLAAGWIAQRDVRIDNLRDDSRQGDRAIIAFLERLSRPGERRFDLGACPDLIAPLAAAAAFAEGATELRNVAHARIKESDRIDVLTAGLRRVGALVVEFPDGLRIERGDAPAGNGLDPHGDHRMAMAFGLLSLRYPGLRVAHPECVSKSYPHFWDDLERFR